MRDKLAFKGRPVERRTAIAIKTFVPKLSSSSIAHLIRRSLDSQKAENIVSVDLHGKADFADSMIIASGTSTRHVGAMADRVVSELKAVGLEPVPVEGKEPGDWVLVDAGDIIVHLFRPETRSHYNLEKMWSVAVPQMELEAAY